MLTKWIWDRRLRPVLAGVLVLGLAMGALTALVLRALLPALDKLGYNIRERHQ